MHEYGHAVASTVLKCNGTTLIDPMCLNDYPAIDPAAGAVFEVTVSALYTGTSPPSPRLCGPRRLGATVSSRALGVVSYVRR